MVDETNPGRSIQLLQELAQKSRLAPPVYEFVELSKAPSSFECRVAFMHEGTPIEWRAIAATKQGAKAAAAAGALNLISGGASDLHDPGHGTGPDGALEPRPSFM